MILSSENHNHLPSSQCISSNSSLSSTSSSISSSSSSSSSPSSSSPTSSTSLSLHSYNSPTQFKHASKSRSPRNSTKRKRHDPHALLSSPLPFPVSTPSSSTASPSPLSKYASTSSCLMPLMMLPPGHMDIEANPSYGPPSLVPGYHVCTCFNHQFPLPQKPLPQLIASTKWKYELQITYHLYYAGFIEVAVARHIELMLHQSRGVHHNLKVAFEWYESQIIQSVVEMRELAHRLRVFASYNIYFCKLMGWQCLWLEVSSTCQGNQVTKNFRYNSRARLPRYPPCPLHY